MLLPKVFLVLCTHSENERSLEVLEISAGGFHSDPQRRESRTFGWCPAVAAAGVIAHHWFCCDACQVVGYSGSGMAANPISFCLHFTTNDIFGQGRVEKCLICPTIYFYPEKTNRKRELFAEPVVDWFCEGVVRRCRHVWRVVVDQVLDADVTPWRRQLRIGAQATLKLNVNIFKYFRKNKKCTENLQNLLKVIRKEIKIVLCCHKPLKWPSLYLTN